MTDHGDYDLRGPDFETFLIGPPTAMHWDADRIVRQSMQNGFPNWQLFRTVDCGESLYRQDVRTWCVAFAIAYCETTLRKGMPAEHIGCLAGWDAYYALMNHKWLIAGMDVADVAGVDPKTYRKVRNHVYAANLASLRHYFVEMGIAIRQLYNRRDDYEPEAPTGKWQNGRGLAHEVTFPGDGCFVVKKAPMSDML